MLIDDVPDSVDAQRIEGLGTSKNIEISNRVVAVRVFERKSYGSPRCSSIWRLTNELGAYVPFLRSVIFWVE
jgi:hypothetical protein